jgi:hypothetical protein
VHRHQRAGSRNRCLPLRSRAPHSGAASPRRPACSKPHLEKGKAVAQPGEGKHEERPARGEQRGPARRHPRGAPAPGWRAGPLSRPLAAHLTHQARHANRYEPRTKSRFASCNPCCTAANKSRYKSPFHYAALPFIGTSAPPQGWATGSLWSPFRSGTASGPSSTASAASSPRPRRPRGTGLLLPGKPATPRRRRGAHACLRPRRASDRALHAATGAGARMPRTCRAGCISSRAATPASGLRWDSRVIRARIHGPVRIHVRACVGLRAYTPHQAWRLAPKIADTAVPYHP